MTNELFIDMLKLSSPSNPELLEHGKKLVAVAEAAKVYDKKSDSGHTDWCEQPIKCDCGYWEFYAALENLER